MPAALKSQGTVVKIGQGDADSVAYGVEVFDTIGKVVSFDGPGGEAAVIDATNLSSAAKEKIIGLPDEGQVSLSLNLDPSDTGQVAARGARAAQTLKWFEITLSDATVIYFTGFVMGFNVSGGVDDKVNGSISIEVTGALTWA